MNYHEVSWEENLFLKGIGGSLDPAIFRNHIAYLSQNGRIVSIEEGQQCLNENKIKEPLISIWFDDGFRGNYKNAFPILKARNIKAALSINSRFVKREEFFWRCKLSYLQFNDGFRYLRSALRKHGISVKISDDLKRLTMDNFSIEIVDTINSLYEKATNPWFREDAFRLFMNEQQVKELHNEGWEIANHSAAHYPISEKTFKQELNNQFVECELFIKKSLEKESNYWVLPFDRTNKTVVNHSDISDSNKKLVFVSNKVNQYGQKDVLYRIGIPQVSGKELIKHLNRI